MLMRSLFCLIFLSAILAFGCSTPVEPADYGDPTSLGEATTSSGITVQLLAPGVATELPSPVIKLVFSAYTEDAAPLELRVQDVMGSVYPVIASGLAGPGQRFEAEVPLLHGQNPFLVRIAENGGARSRVIETSFIYAGDNPGARFSLRPAVGGECLESLAGIVTSATHLCVHGQVTPGAAALASAEIVFDDVRVQAELRDGTFRVTGPIPTDRMFAIAVTVTDAAGNSTRVTRPVIQDATSPTLEVPLAVGEPIRTERTRAEITGVAEDDHGLARVTIENGAGGVVEAEVDVAGNFRRNVQLEPGTNRFTVVAEDHAGNAARMSLEIVRDRIIRLRVLAGGRESLLALDRRGLQEVLPESAQRDIEVATISLRTPVVEALRAIREPERFGLDTSGWGPAEQNMANLLRMTPDNADLADSSLEELLAIAPAVSLPSPRILAELLQIAPTDTILSLDTVADVVLDNIVATHPLTTRDENGDPAIQLSMHDVLRDLTPLAGRFGPNGPHPGFLSGSSRADILEPGFLLTVPARSNLEIREGIDASRGGKDFLFIGLPDGSLFLDFLSDKSTVVGLVDEPTVDLRFSLPENESFMRGGSVREARPDAERHGFFRGSGQAFGAPPWDIEHVIAEGAYRQFYRLYAPTFEANLRYSAGSINEALVIDWDRGWVDITTSGGIGDPPPPIYLWDVFAEVAQLRLHEGQIPEGQADVAFRVPELPVGITADSLIEQLRPTLQAQQAEIAQRIVSREALIGSQVDFYVVPSSSGLRLQFRGPQDGAGEVVHPTPGFFSDRELTNKISSTEPMGTDDITHEKLVPVVGMSAYFADETSGVFRIDIVEVNVDAVGVRVTPVRGGS